MTILILVISFSMFFGIAQAEDQEEIPVRLPRPVCKTNTPKPYLYNGNYSAPASYPYVAYLVELATSAFHKDKDHYYGCAATIIHKQWALTTALCLNHDELKAKQLVVGAVDMTEWTRRKYWIQLRYVHPDYTFYPTNNLYLNNFGLVKTGSDLRFDPYVKPIRINWKREWDTELGRQLKVSYVGWGESNVTEINRYQQKFVFDYIFPIKRCEELANKGDFVLATLNNHICVASATNYDLCPSDPGGPLIQNDKLIGVMNHVRCGPEGAAVAEDILNGLSWIRTTLREKGAVELYDFYGKDVPVGYSYMLPGFGAGL